MSSRVTKTYGSRPRAPVPSSPPSGLSSSPVRSPTKKTLKRTCDSLDLEAPPKKRTHFLSAGSSKPKPKTKTKPLQPTKQKTLTQLHFSLDASILRTCPSCDLSYTKGAPDDEALHKAHCARVLKGMEWGREEERAKEVGKKDGVLVEEVAAGVKLKDGRKGRVICFRADAGGKIGHKLTVLLETINLALSAPPLTPAALAVSKAYLMLVPVPGPSHREKIVGCVIAQRIKTAMAIADPPSCEATFSSDEIPTAPPEHKLIPLHGSSSLFVHPTPLPTPLGIPRLFTASAFRRLGVASHLLDAAARTFVHGCELSGKKGEVAFTQPTGAGAGVMRGWGGGGVRIYEE
ncbi:hypothetical protein HWV62_9948 [Athelia sp. TMB]|nr:hypothetical protein HWV62_9948 [Athelia sp. TMB]